MTDQRTIRSSIQCPILSTHGTRQLRWSVGLMSLLKLGSFSANNNLDCFEFMFVLECCLFLGRLNCRFRTGFFVVKPRWKTSDYLTRNYLDSNTPLFYGLKQRKKAGFRTQSHITHHRQRRQDYTSEQLSLHKHNYTVECRSKLI
jgi:hypothetical protein